MFTTLVPAGLLAAVAWQDGSPADVPWVQKDLALLPAVQSAGPAALLKESLDRFREEAGFPGGVAAASRSDSELVVVATGVRDDRGEDPVQPTDRLLAGSIGKTFLAAVVLKAWQDGELELDDALADWLEDVPWYPRIPNAGDLTIRMLMRHTSGIPDHLSDPAFLQRLRESPLRPWPHDELVKTLLDRPALFPADSNWSYADANYLLLGYTIEHILQRPYEELVRAWFLEPLDLDGIVPQEELRIPGVIMGHCRAGAVLGFPPYVLVDGAFTIHPQMEWTGGGMATTAGDLCRWTRLLFGGTLLAPATMKEMLDGVPARTGPEQRYGLGVQLRTSVHGPVYYHGGWFPGYMAETAFYPRLDLALTVQVNSDAHTSPATFQRFLDQVASALEP